MKKIYMKKCLVLLIFLIQSASIVSKAQIECGSTFNSQVIQSSDPSRYNRYIQLEQHIANYIASINNSNSTERLITPNGTIIIPVVVHVLHNGEPIGVGNNISDAQIQSQIDVLNEDFRRLNADRVNTPAAFTGVAADPNIEFRLTCIDPNGNATNGAHRVQTNANSFTVQFNLDNSINEQNTGIKFTAQGGTDAWPTDRYLNMWVCNIASSANGQLLGYAQFPFDFATSPNTDGVVMLNTAFGRVGNLRFQYDQGRTTTHEVGHWLNLFHIWGDDGNACTGSDQCGDTPNQGGGNQACPGFPNISCSNTPNGDMFMNYMDYTVDACKNIYTQGQTNRMHATFAQGGPRAAFINNYFSVNERTEPICTSGTVTAQNLSCLPITWSVISGPAIIISGQNTNVVTLQRTGDGVAIIRATAGGYIDEKNVSMGFPFDDINTIVSAEDINISVSHPSEFIVNAYRWFMDGVFFRQTSAPLLKTTRAYECHDWSVSFVTPCGESPETIPISVGCGQRMMVLSVSPNPTSGNIKASLFEKGKPEKKSSIKQIVIVDKSGITKKQYNYGDGIQDPILNTSDLASDIYTITAFDGKTWTAAKFIKN